MVEPHAAADEPGEVVAGDRPLLRGQPRAAVGRQGVGELLREGDRGPAARGEDEDGAEVAADAADEGPHGGVAAVAPGGVHGVEVDLLERDRSPVLDDAGDLAAEALEPTGNRLGVPDAAAQEQELGRGRGQGEDGLVGRPPFLVGQHLVLVDREQGGGVPLEEAGALGLEGGDEHPRPGVLRHVPGRDADVPTPPGPLRPFVVGEGAGGDGEDRLAPDPGLDEALEDQGLARPGGGLEDDVLARAEPAEGLQLPEVGNGEGVRHGASEGLAAGEASGGMRLPLGLA